VEKEWRKACAEEIGYGQGQRRVEVVDVFWGAE